MACENSKCLAITGATGFIGQRFLADCTASNIQVSALTRRPQSAPSDVRWVQGDLFDADALESLLEGADCLVHLAGATKALRREDFGKINTQATVDLARLCRAKKIRHFIFLSSLAATRPEVSPYAMSKAEAEKALAEQGGDMAISVIRAPAVLGPGDSATYPLFSNLAKGVLLAPGSARNSRFSIIDVADLSELLVALAKVTTPVSERIAPFGHARLDWPSIAQSAERTLNRPVRTLYIPPWLMKIAAHAVDFFARVSGKAQVMSADKLGEINAGDWIADHPVKNPMPLDETMRRCLVPFGNRTARDA